MQRELEASDSKKVEPSLFCKVLLLQNCSRECFLLLIVDVAHKARCTGFKYCSRMTDPKSKPLSTAERLILNSYLLCLPQLLFFFPAAGEKQTELQNCAMHRIALFFFGWLFLFLFPLPGYVLPAALVCQGLASDCWRFGTTYISYSNYILWLMALHITNTVPVWLFGLAVTRNAAAKLCSKKQTVCACRSVLAL